MDKFVRTDHYAGEKGAHGARWVTTAAGSGENIEVYGLRFADPGFRVTITSYTMSNTPQHGRVCMDLDSAVEFATEILRLAAELRPKDSA